jgi:zinc protease
MFRHSGRLGFGAAGPSSSPRAAAAADAPWTDPRKLAIPPLHQIQEISPKRVELANGMVVYFLEDHDFPIVDLQALIRVGDVYEPPDKIGLASIAAVHADGGSTTTGDALDEKLESMGARVEVGIGDTQGTASLSALSQDLEETLRILGSILRTPAFPDDKIDLAKKQLRTSIASRNDEGLDIAFRELLTLVYGKGHPYARYPEYATVDAVTRDDLVAFHKAYFHPDRMILTVYGDFQTKKVEKLLGQIFGDWPRSTQPLPPDPTVGKTETRGNLFADKSDMTNSMIILGQEGMRMDNPDYAAMTLFHGVMSGGSFSGRLIQIRTKRGLPTAHFLRRGLAPSPDPRVLRVTHPTTLALGYLRAEVDKHCRPFPRKAPARQGHDPQFPGGCSPRRAV